MAQRTIRRYDAPHMPAPRDKQLAAIAIVLGAVSVAFPMLGLPALLVALLVFIATSGRARLVTGLVAGILSFGGFTRFVIETAVPNIVAAGQRSGEEKAVSRLRNVRKAEEWAGELGLGAVPFTELLRDVPGRGALLNPLLFAPAGDGIYRAEGYLFAVHVLEGGRWVAYAWPAGEKHGGRRAFFIDPDDRICETAEGYAGLGHGPAARAAFVGDTPCTGDWRPWRGKKARPTTDR